MSCYWICVCQNIDVNPILNTLSLLSIFIFSQEAFFFGESMHCKSWELDISDNTSSYSPSVNRHRECLSYTTSSLPNNLFESPSLVIPLRIFRLFIEGSTFSSPCWSPQPVLCDWVNSEEFPPLN